MNDYSQLHAQQQALLRQAIDGLNSVLPIQAPLQDFIHFNPLLHYEQLPFEQALRTVYAQSGSLGYLPTQEYRQFYQQGRITQADLQHVLTLDGIPSEDQAVYLDVLVYDIGAISFQQMRWQVEENHAFECFQAGVPQARRAQLLAAAGQNEATAIQALWESCLRRLDLSYDLVHPEALLNLRLTDQDARQQNPEAMPDAEVLMRQTSRELLHQLVDEVGKGFTFRTLMRKLTGVDVMDELLPALGRYLGGWLDQGISSWQGLPQAQGFYRYWRSIALHDISAWLAGMETWVDYIESLADDPLETIHQELIRIGIDPQHWAGYLQALALELPGWSGMFNWRAEHPGYLGSDLPVKLEDYLAVRLVLEHLHCRRLTREHWQVDAAVADIRGYFNHHVDEFFVRYHAYNTTLPEYLQHLAQEFLESQEDILPQEWHQLAHQILTWNLAPEMIMPVGSDIYRKAWRLFQLAQYQGLDGKAVAALDQEYIERMLSIVDVLDDPNTSGYIWLRAYEYHFQRDVFNALLNKHADVMPTREPAVAQLIFCMDDREESVRRHLEEVAPELETFGAAGVFGMPNNWRALDSYQPIKLAQPAVTPIHTFHEIPSDKEAARLPAHRRRWRLLERVKRLKYHRMRHGLISTSLALPLLAPLALVELVGRSLAPRRYERWSYALQRRISVPMRTRVAYTAMEALPDASAEHNQLGLTLEEKVAKVAHFLQLTGLTERFSPLIVLMAHRSRHLNNPHVLAYGCGACSGRFGVPNARAFAHSANEAAVRARLLLDHGIEIPSQCWFVAGDHDTTSDRVLWPDADLVPSSHQALFLKVQKAVARAVSLSAQERCRKFASAPKRPSPKQAKRHVEARAASPDQVRAELGHQGCALAFIGPRRLSQGIFWDRRSFLISYDPAKDPDGTWLEAQLQGNGVVGVGIQMDYYFSRLQNGLFGSGSKVTHNVNGLFGVFEGGSGDLRTGLAQQMVELHEPMRLLVVVEAELETVGAIHQRHSYLRQLLDNAWVFLAVKPPQRNEIHVFEPGKGLVLWQEPLAPLPEARLSTDWYAGQHGYLPPARIKGDLSHA